VAQKRTRIEGLDQTIRALKSAPDVAAKELREDIGDTSRIVAQRTKQNAPFDRGATREAIDYKPPRGRSLTGKVIMKPGEFRGRNPLKYLNTLEFSTHPFVRPTSEQEKANYVNRLRRAGTRIEQTMNRGSRFV